MAVVGRSFLRYIKGLENVGASVFKTKSAADDALKAVKVQLEKELSRGATATATGKADQLVRVLLERARVAAGRGVTTGFRVVVDTEDGASTVALKNIVRDVRRGRVTEVLDSLGVPSNSAFRDHSFVEHMRRALNKAYPDAAVDDMARRLRSVRELPPSLFAANTTAYDSADDLARLIATNDEAARLVRAVEKSLKNGRPVVAKGLFFGVTLTTGGLVTVCAALFESANRAAGCWRVYRDQDTGEVLSCRVRYASCEIERKSSSSGGGGGGALPYNKYCDRYPTVVTETSCATEWTGETPCVRCDPTAAANTPEHLRVEDYVDPGDMYTCRAKPSLGEMLGQVVLDSPHVLTEVAGDVVDGAESVFSTVWQAAKRVALWCVATLCLLLFFAVIIFYIRTTSERSPSDGGRRYWRLRGPDNEESEEEDEEGGKESDSDSGVVVQSGE